MRSGDTYIDPEVVLRGAAFSVHLVPAEGETEAQRRFGEMIRDAFDDELSTPGGGGIGASVGAWLRSTVDPAQIVRLAVHYSSAMSVPVHLAGVADATWQWYRAQAHCTAAGAVATVMQQSASSHLVVLVAGFGSSSGNGAGIDSVDLASTGVPADRVMRFSYSGGKTPASTGSPFATLDTTTYTSTDSQAALDGVADAARDVVAAVAAANPGAPIDVIAPLARRCRGVAGTADRLRREEPCRRTCGSSRSPRLIRATRSRQAPISCRDSRSTSWCSTAPSERSTSSPTTCTTTVRPETCRSHPRSWRRTTMRACLKACSRSRSAGDGIQSCLPATPVSRGRGNITVDYGGLAAHGRLPGAPAVTARGRARDPRCVTHV